MSIFGSNARVSKAVLDVTSKILKGEQIEESVEEQLDEMSSKEKMKKGLYNSKMDPVGQEDGDIDNDGDEDKSDEYLMNRRKAIKKAMAKESVEESIGGMVRKAVDVVTGKAKKDRDAATRREFWKQQYTAMNQNLKDIRKKQASQNESVEDVHEIAAHHSFGGWSTPSKSWTYISFKNKHSDKPDMGGESDEVGSSTKAHEEHARIIRHLHKTMPDKIAQTQSTIWRRGSVGDGHAAVRVRTKHVDEVHKAIEKAGGKVTHHNHDKVSESVDLDKGNVNTALQHDCATHVYHEEYGMGRCIPGMHTLVQVTEETAVVTHYDVMFESDEGPFIMESVPVTEMKVVKSESHMHSKKKTNENYAGNYGSSVASYGKEKDHEQRYEKENPGKKWKDLPWGHQDSYSKQYEKNPK